MRTLSQEEVDYVAQYFADHRCNHCPYLAREGLKMLCGLVKYQTLVTVPECLEPKK